MKEETALRKEKEAVCCYVHVLYMYKLYKDAYAYMYMYTCNMCMYNVAPLWILIVGFSPECGGLRVEC